MYRRAVKVMHEKTLVAQSWHCVAVLCPITIYMCHTCMIGGVEDDLVGLHIPLRSQAATIIKAGFYNMP
jgi:hypothetical protein